VRPHLLDRDHDLDLHEPATFGADDLVTDLELTYLLGAMAAGDRFLWEVAQEVLLHPIDDPTRIRYRQDVLRDCLDHPDIASQLFAIAGDALAREKKIWFGGRDARPERVVHRSVEVLSMLVEELRHLRSVADARAHDVRSDAMTALLATLSDELADDYLAAVGEQLDQLRFRYGTRLSARVGKGNEGTEYRLHANHRPSWRLRLPWHTSDALSFQLAERDVAGFQALGELRDRALRPAADAIGQATEHLLEFFAQLRAELAFYLGCVNLHRALTERSGTVCFPDPLPSHETTLVTRGLYDPSLRLLTAGPVTGIDVDADGATVVFITGANRGGKSTLLRAIGTAHLMMQCGMFVPAAAFAADVRSSMLTHFKREEDATLTSGKLDEELRRMSAIVDHLTPRSMVLCNETFASTNEREGSQLAHDLVTALRDAGVKVVYVTHLYDLARTFFEESRPDTWFLRARPPTENRPFEITPGDPLPTSHAARVYEKVFGEPLADNDATPDTTRPTLRRAAT
jgi:hypothetical protein